MSLRRHVPPRGQFIIQVDELLQVGKVQTITFFGLCCQRKRRDARREPKWQAHKNLRARIAM